MNTPDSPGPPRDMQAMIAHARRQAQAAAVVDTRTRGPGDHPAEVGPLPDGAIPGYDLVRELHRGGQGVVYLAVQNATRRNVAIKVMKEGPFGSPREKARFQREVEILGQLRHPNIVAIHDSGIAAGCHFFVMNYIDGLPLHEYVDLRRQATRAGAPTGGWTRGATQATSRAFHEEMLQLFARICGAVDAAHERGIVHRDLKPGNICVDAAGEPHILDFGLARIDDAAGDMHAPVMTATGQFMGSVPWASPEQAAAVPGTIDVRTDVYSLGVILYQMLTDEFPYPVIDQTMHVLHNIQFVEPIRPASFDAAIDPELETIILKCLSKERDRRYSTAGAIGRDINRYLAGDPIEARRDSIGYVMRKRVAGLARRHRVAGLLLSFAAAIGLAQGLVRPVIFEWTPLNTLYERWLMQNGAPAGALHAMSQVRVVGIPEPDELARVAARAGMQIDPRAASSARGLHGRLMQRLAVAAPRVVVWDVVFRAPAESDPQFVDGVRALAEHGIDVVVATPDWSMDANDLPVVSPTLRPYVRWGAASVHFQAEEPWRIELARQRDQTDPLASLVLRGVAAARRPGAYSDIRIHEDSGIVNLVYYRTPGGATNLKQYVGEPDRLARVALMRETRDESGGVRRGDLIVLHTLVVPPDAVLNQSTLSYGDVLSADDDQLRGWFAGRAVVIGRVSDPNDSFACADGRRIAGCYGHARGMDDLLTQLASSTPAPAGGITPTFVVAAAALMGVGFTRLGTGSRLRRTLIAASALGLVGGAIAVARVYHVIYNPLVALAALMIASELAAAVPVRTGRRREPP